MTLRVNSEPTSSTATQPSGAAAAAGGTPTASGGGDGWPSRLAKLIPAEALGLYGAGTAIVPTGNKSGLWVLAAASLLVAAAVRFFATRDDTGRPQWAAIAIAMVSFALWVTALAPEAGPIDLGANAFYAALAALIWATVVPIFYTGSPRGG